MVERTDIPGQLVGQVSSGIATRAVQPRVTQPFLSLPLESTLQATVLRSDVQGLAVLRTPYGEIPVQTQLALAPGSALTLKVTHPAVPREGPVPNNAPVLTGKEAVPTGQRVDFSAFQARIITVNGKPPGPEIALFNTGNTTQGSSSGSYQEIRGLNQFPPGLLTRPGASATYSPQQGTEQVSITKDAAIVSVREGARLEALVLRPSAEIQHYVPPSSSQSAVSPSPVTLSGVPQIPSGSALQVHVLATEIPKITVGSLPPVTSGGDQFQTPPASSSVALPAGTPAGLTPGAEITSQRVLLPQVQAASSQPAFTATVVGTERSGEIVLQSPLGTLKLPADSTLPQGSRLLLEVTSLSAKPASIPLLPLADSDTLQLVAGLKGAEGATQALLQTLQQLDTELGGAQVKQQFPATDQFLAARALWFMHAAITGQAEHWVHPETRKLLEHYQRPDLIQKLDQDFQTMQHLARTPNADGWQTLMFPVVDGNNVHYITFYNRQQKRRHKDTGEEEGTDWRFIVELTLQHLGAVQFDGLYHNADGARSLDLYIRSSERFPQEMQREILAIYNAEMELAGVDGSLQFVAGEAFPMHPGYPTHPVGEGSILA